MILPNQSRSVLRSSIAISKSKGVRPSVEIVIDGVPMGEVTGVDEINGVIFFEPVGGFGGPLGGGGGSSPPQRCYPCELQGGVVFCCYAANAPRIPECQTMGERLIDQCLASGGRPEDCTRKAQCAVCQCIEQRVGPQYCNCAGFV
jgi:hypothetical protein